MVNDRGQSLPPGNVGEVLAYGETVSQGYFNGEAQEKFTRIVQSTTGTPQLGGWYATGDFGLIDEIGDLHLRGRADDQIKISGQVRKVSRHLSRYKYIHWLMSPFYNLLFGLTWKKHDTNK